MIVGTAGHIDHGKTTLVRALTGVDTDRLPEERRRGISIALGYAFLDAPDGTRIGFIDVPGHERLVHTMLAGATGIDLALLLVAADDGVMPQTREHLAVLALLGIGRGVAVITKCDRVDDARVQAVAAEVRCLLAPTPLAGVPVLAVSALTGQGVDLLRSHLLAEAAAELAPADDGRYFRLAIDRAFTLDGAGTVVTGTVHAGRVAVGDTLTCVPGGQTARVRSLHAQNRPVAAAQAGARCALALAGVDKADVARGQWLVAAGAAGGLGQGAGTDRLDAELLLWHDAPRPVRSGTPVQVHIGAACVPGTVAVLDPTLLEPGQRARVQLVLRRPVGAWWGDRVVLRDASASRTLAGGRVLDPQAPVRHRRTPQRLAELEALSRSGLADRLQALLAAAPQGVDLRRFAAAQGGPLPADQAVQAVAVRPATAAFAGLLRHTDAHGDWALGADPAARTGGQVLQALADFHASHPEELGPDAARLRRLAAPRLPDALWRALLARLQSQDMLQQRGVFVHLPAHGVQLSAAEERLAQKLGPLLDAAGFDGAWVRDLARTAAEPEPLVRVTLARLAQRGELFQVVKDLYLPPATVARLTALVRQLAAAQGGAVTAAAFRDASGLGRKRAIQILEHFDRIGLLRRVGDVHRLRSDCGLFEDRAA